MSLKITYSQLILILCLSCVFFLGVCCCFYKKTPEEKFVIMSYNVQSFFDDVDNGTEYRDYDPGTGNWDTEHFLEKAQKIAKVIKKSVPGGPDIVALQEVENQNALEILCGTWLKGSGYRYRIIVPARDSPTNTAILSKVTVQRVRAYSLHAYGGMPLRNIIEVEICHKGKVLYLFNNHWKSKRDGVYRTENSRKEAAALIALRVRNILYTDPYADIIVLGDLNENQDEYYKAGYQTALMPLNVDVPEYLKESCFFLSDSADFSQKSENGVVFYESWYEENRKETGSYVYKNEWQTPDHILFTRGLFHKEGFIYKSGSFHVMDSPFLLDPATGYPKGWDHTGNREGYSDHLPILITVLFTGS